MTNSKVVLHYLHFVLIKMSALTPIKLVYFKMIYAKILIIIKNMVAILKYLRQHVNKTRLVYVYLTGSVKFSIKNSMNALNLMNGLVSNQLLTNVCLGMELASQHMIRHAILTKTLILNITHGQDALLIMIIVMVIEIYVLQIK